MIKMNNEKNQYVFMYPPPLILEEKQYTKRDVKETIQNTKFKGEIGVYIHIPFCEKRCHYCGYYTHINSRSNPVKKYFDQVLNTFTILKNKKVKINSIAIGGGTPNYKQKELIFFLKKLNILYNFKKNHVSIELSPNNLTKEFIIELKNIGIQSISLGIQTFNKKLLKKINRDYNISLIKTIQLCTKYIKDVTIDLIVGLPYSKEKNTLDDFKIANNLNISGINFYKYFSHPKSYFSKKKIESDINYKKINEILNKIFKITSKNYFFESVYLLRRKNLSVKEIHYPFKWAGGQILGIGPSAHSFINNKIMVNDLNNKMTKIYSLTKDDIIRGIAVLGIKNIELKFNLFPKDINPIKYFQDELLNLKNKSLITLKSNSIILTTEGIIKWPEVCYEFYSNNYKRRLKKINSYLGARFIQ